MAGKGMGCAMRGGGAVMSGSQNRTVSSPSKKSGPVMMKSGGPVNQHKKMAMGKKVKGYRKGGMCD